MGQWGNSPGPIFQLQTPWVLKALLPRSPRLFPHLGQPSQGRGDGSWPGGPGQSTNCGGPLIGSQGQKPGVQPWGVEEHHQNWPVSFCQLFFQLNMMVNSG